VTLYERYDSSVLTYLRTVLREHPVAADDIFQETFVRLFRERKRREAGRNDGQAYTPVANVRGWIFRVAHNLAISYLRSLRQTVSLDDEELDVERWDERLMVPVEESFEELYGEEDPLTSERMYQKLRDCVELLPQSLRQVYVLREFNGLEYDEVAKIVGCSQEAARMRLSRARSTLRKALEKYL
jgi:RNA polymerase sigma-70 factor (ECF subfamily)